MVLNEVTQTGKPRIDGSHFMKFLNAGNENFPHLKNFDIQEQDIASANLKEMEEVAVRIRLQLQYILRSVRHWEARDRAVSDPLRKRYSAFEGALCRYDLSRHWALYRFAMGELQMLRQQEKHSRAA